jgi:hypothetical protein
MNKMLKLAALLSVALAAGCAHIDISSPKSLSGLQVVGSPTQADRQVVVRNSGIHVLWWFPLASGDMRWDEEKQDIKGGLDFFDDHCNTAVCMDVLEGIARRENCDLVDVYFTDMTKSGFDVTSMAGLFAWAGGLYEVQACGILRPRSAAPEKEAAR